MKKILLSNLLLFVSMFVLGQKLYTASKASFVSEQQPAVMIVMPHSVELVSKALELYKMQHDYSTKKHPMAYQTFWNTSLMQNNVKNLDLIFRVKPNDNPDKSNTEVFLLLSSNNEKKRYSEVANDFTEADAKAFLYNLAIFIDEYVQDNLDTEIKLQTLFLAKAEKKQKKCTNQCAKLDAKKEVVQQRFTHNKKNAIKKDSHLKRRISATQNTLAYQKTNVEKQRNYLSQLTNQQPRKIH